MLKLEKMEGIKMEKTTWVTLSEANTTVAEKLSAATNKILAENPNMKYVDAFNKAQIENPSLAAEYASMMRNPEG